MVDRGLTEGFEDIESYLDRTAEARLADYVEFLRIPSISTLPEHAADVHAAASFLAEHLGAAGMEHVVVSPTAGHPVVYADWLHAEGVPTILLYGHYDVQPVDPIDLWLKPPFDPRVENGRIYARGAADDKGQVHLHLHALAAWLATRGRLPINVKVIIEGEEESGSENLDAWLDEHRELVAADLAVVSDTNFFDGNLPAITVGLRGMMYCQIDVTGPDLDLHSGSYGGTVRNPANALATIVAGLHDADGRVAVPGFYDDVVSLSDDDRAELARLPFDEDAYRASTGVPSLVGEAGYTTLERRGARPTLDVNGIWGGFQGEGAKTIIPAHAHAKVSCRLVPNQRPDRVFEMLRDRVMELAPDGVRVDMVLINTGLPSLTPSTHPATNAAAACLRAVFGVDPVFIREGGSIPVVASFQSILGIQSVLIGFAPPDDQAHAPNESMRLDNYERGLRAIVRLWSALASTDLGTSTTAG